jgi:hypothetical protein
MWTLLKTDLSFTVTHLGLTITVRVPQNSPE